MFQQGENEKIKENMKLMKERLQCSNEVKEKISIGNTSENSSNKPVAVVSSVFNPTTNVESVTTNYQQNFSTIAISSKNITNILENKVSSGKGSYFDFFSQAFSYYCCFIYLLYSSPNHSY